MGDYVDKRVLVVVKTYTNPSATYGETVCSAGVDLDTKRFGCCRAEVHPCNSAVPGRLNLRLKLIG
ncbi:MAG TPA: hypothetical protein VGM94_01680 [Galbitalea sp.]